MKPYIVLLFSSLLCAQVQLLGQVLVPAQPTDNDKIPRPNDDSPTNLSASAVETFMPAAYAAFRHSLVGDFGKNDVAAGLKLVESAKEALSKTNVQEIEERQAADTCRGAWRLALRIYLGASNNAAARTRFLSAWNRSLGDPDILVASQLYALNRVWDKSLLTPKFWKLVEETNSRRVVEAESWLMGYRADDDSLRRFLKIYRQRTNMDPDLRRIMNYACASAFNKLTYIREATNKVELVTNVLRMTTNEVRFTTNGVRFTTNEELSITNVFPSAGPLHTNLAGAAIGSPQYMFY